MTTQLSLLLGPTPHQVAGPFYPGDDAFSIREDLAAGALGVPVFLTGSVRDQLGLPVVDASVRLWQACATGRYDDSRDPNPAPIDPNFGYHGMAVTGAGGHFSFRTVMPGEYKDTETWTRPPHLHFRVSAPGFETLTTQMYFAGNSLNEADLILEKTPREEWSRLVVSFEERDGVLTGHFGIVLQELFP